MSKYEKGQIVKGTVSGIEPYGIFIRIDECYNGLIHISEVSDSFVRDPAYFVSLGEIINVKILEISEENHQMKLSIKHILYREGQKRNRKRVIETKTGFRTLAYKLPIWIDQNLKNAQKMKNKINSIDK